MTTGSSAQIRNHGQNLEHELYAEGLFTPTARQNASPNHGWFRMKRRSRETQEDLPHRGNQEQSDYTPRPHRVHTKLDCDIFTILHESSRLRNGASRADFGGTPANREDADREEADFGDSNLARTTPIVDLSRVPAEPL